jgi:gamma-glutamyltranspeptidase/glutathione hydrolase
VILCRMVPIHARGFRSLGAVLSALTVVFAGAASAQEGEAGMGTYPNACVAADHYLASQAGAEILRAGGNAVDAAVATSFALSVVRPYSCGIGGGGFMVIYLREHPRHKGPIVATLNYRETAPAAVRPDIFENDPDPHAATHGGKAVCVPGTVAGLLEALEKYGTLDRRRVLAPAIRLAREGFTVDRHYVESTHDDELVIPWLRNDHARQKRFDFLWNRFLRQGAVREGDRIDIPEQAAALEQIAEQGRDAFYKGEIAHAIVAAVRADGGWITLDDLAACTPRWVQPLRATFRGREVITMPPPSSGGIVLAQVFTMLESRWSDFDRIVREKGHNSPEYIHFVAEAARHAFADRARYLADPDFAHVPLRTLLDRDRLTARAARIDPDHALPPETCGTGEIPPDDAGTSHFSVVDRWGNAVACTETMNLIFGSFVAVERFGFILNNEMDDFLTRTGRPNAFALSHADRNRPQPGKRPLSSMTPTIVLDDDGAVRLVVGGAGGPRIISATLQAALNALVWDMPADAALAAPRFHHQWEPDRLDLEPPLYDHMRIVALTMRGHKLAARKSVGNVQIIRRVSDAYEAACDPRKGGKPAGY